jgi:alkylation response protein AidB-like acyl-CoA dehydrogenase
MIDPATATQGQVRNLVKTWLEEHWNADLTLLEWRRRLLASGWAVPSWSERWHGLALPAWSEHIVAEEIRTVGAIGLPIGSGMGLAAPTILQHGPDHIRERFLAAIVTGEETWCQLFSEPGAGSDLAGLTTRAQLDGERWVVSGQKVWNTGAQNADFGMLVARTDWDVPKHSGLTYFALPMRQEGVEVRPLKQMNYHASFNEVFLSDALIPKEYVIGEVGGGWATALTTLSYERQFASLSRARLGGSGRAASEARHEADQHYSTYSWYPQRAGRADLAIEFAQRAGRRNDPLVRQEIARLIAMQRVSIWTESRARAARALGKPPGAEGSIGKLSLSQVARQAAHVHSMIAAASGMLSGPDSSYNGTIAEVLISVPAQSIAGGTDEIQRNILGERILGLPREPAVDSDVPFRTVRRNE